MKFHHLARHNQLFGSHQHGAVSPNKQTLIGHQAVQLLQQQQQQQHHQLNINNNNNNNNNNNANMSADEDEDFNGDNPISFYDSLIAEQQHHQLATGQRATSANNDQSGSVSGLDANNSNGFLMDKNKKLFPQKLWELIHNPSIQHCLRWSQDGQRVYLNRNEFETYYLKTPNNQFHTQKAISFVRQMNMYGFRKVDDCYYENDNFRRDQQHLLKNMIRRHPNKGLFVGLDHHQLAAAAAAQQALQVNHQLQQLEHQHKHRAEQALRLNNYLNSHHQFHQHHQAANLVNHHHHHSQQLNHSNIPFEQMSTHIAQAAVNHLTQQQQQQHQNAQLQQQQQQKQQQLGDNVAKMIDQTQQFNAKIENLTQQHARSSTMQTTTTTTAAVSKNINQQPIHHQPTKKSRLLNDFYATTNIMNISNNNNNNDNQIVSSQDSMHSTGSADTPPSQCSGSVNSGSAGSPQPSLSKVQNSLKQLSKTARLGEQNNYKFNNHHNIGHHHLNEQSLHLNQHQQQQQALICTDLSRSNQSLAAARQAALHETLVRSLLQLKHGHQHHNSHNRPQDLIASIQQQQRDSRTLLESLASLSSAGTGSIVDPASNSPTERTGTPPSEPNSPTSALDVVKCDDSGQYNDQDNNNQDIVDDDDDDDDGDVDQALNLAKSSSNDRQTLDKNNYASNEMNSAISIVIANNDNNNVNGNNGNEDDDDDDDDGNKSMIAEDLTGVDGAGSPLDSAKKVRKFLEDHMIHNMHVGGGGGETIDDEFDKNIDHKIKLEGISDVADLPHRKRIKLLNIDDNLDIGDMSVELSLKNLISAICKRKGNCYLNNGASNKVAKYTECFLDILLDDASLIAANSNSQENRFENAPNGDDTVMGTQENDDGKLDDTLKQSHKLDGAIDDSSLSLAIKLVPSKLLDAIQLQQQRVMPDQQLDDELKKVDATDS